MRHIFVGDVQACYDPLMDLMEKINYDSTQDSLCFCGDLIGRGPQALKVLQWIKNQPLAQVVLGNHDIFLLMLLYEVPILESVPDDLKEVVFASDKDELAQWLLSQPLIRQVTPSTVMVHAGIPPQWQIEQALQKNQLWSHALESSENIQEFLSALWADTASEPCGSNNPGHLSYMVNAFTRMRFCDEQGTLDFIYKKHDCPLDSYRPWFEWRGKEKMKIIFGHWSALREHHDIRRLNTMAMDTGCVFGGCLSAYILEEDRVVQQSCERLSL